MKAKNLLVLLAAAAMLGTAALPAYAETTGENASQYSVSTPEIAAFAAEDAIAVQDSVSESNFIVNGTAAQPVAEETKYYKVESGVLVEATAADFAVKIEPEADGCHVTLNNAVFANPGAAQGYVAVYASHDLHLTLQGSNTLPGPVVSDGKLTIDGTGSAQVTVDNTSNWGCMLSGVNGAEIGGSVKITGQNTAAFGVTGLYTRTGDAVIKDSADVSLNGNMENGVLNMQASLHIQGGKLYINGARVQDNEYRSGGNGVYASGDVTVDGGTLEITNIDGKGIAAGSGKASGSVAGITGSVTINGGTVKISDIRGLTVGNSVMGQGINVYNDVVVNGGTVELSNIGGNGVSLGHMDREGNSAGNFILNGGTVRLSDIRRIDYGEYGYGGKGITTAADIKINGGTVTARNVGVNDLFSNGNTIIRGGEVLLAKSGSALVSYNGITIDNGKVYISDSTYTGISAYQGDITINGGSVTTDYTDEAINTVQGDVNITGGTVEVKRAQKSGISVYQGSSEDYQGTIRITGGKVTVDAAENALQAFSGGVVFGGNAVVDAHSQKWNTIGSGNITISGNDCDITLRTDSAMTIGGWVKLTDADEIIALCGSSEKDAAQIAREEHNGEMQLHPVDYKYTHIVKGTARPAENVTIKADGWTEGGTPTLPTVTDEAGNPLNAKVYYKVKGADDAAYTDVVPTAVGEYEVKLVVPANGEYLESVYYASFAITAKPTQPTPTPTPAQSNSSTTTVTATAKPTATPRAEAKAQSTPATVTAAIPKTADTFPYVGLAALMGTAALGMVSIILLRKKHQ